MLRFGGDRKKRQESFRPVSRRELPRYLRPRRRIDSLAIRAGFRGMALLILAGVILHGLERGEHITDPTSPLYNLEGRLAGLFGQQAQRIYISGLVYHSPQAVLKAISVHTGSSLLGFEPEMARRLLENLDWVKHAEVARLYPNGLKISIKERQPIALWQTDGAFYPVDADGVALVSLDPRRFANLLLVTGDGANVAAKALVNQLEAMPILRSRVKAAARVGNRRWNLYMASGLKVLLPEEGEHRALKRLAALIADGRITRKAVKILDLRLPDRIALLSQEEAAKDTGKQPLAQ